MVLLTGLKERTSNTLGVESSSIAYNMGNTCVTSANEGAMSSLENWCERPPIPDGVRPFGTVRYMQGTARNHNPKPRDVRCIMVGLTRNQPSA